MLQSISNFWKRNVTAVKSQKYILMVTLFFATCGLVAGFLASSTKDAVIILDVVAAFGFPFIMLFCLAFFVTTTTKCPGPCVTAAGIAGAALSAALVGILVERVLFIDGAAFITGSVFVTGLFCGVVFLIAFTLTSWTKYLVDAGKR